MQQHTDHNQGGLSGQAIEWLISVNAEAVHFLRKERNKPQDAKDMALGALKHVFGVSEMQLEKMSSDELTQLSGTRCTHTVGKTLGIIGNACLQIGQRRDARLYLEKAVDLDPDNQKILFTVSTAFHSEQWRELKGALARTDGDEISSGDVRVERIIGEVFGLRATHRLLATLGTSERTLMLDKCREPLMALWTTNNLAHYYYTLGVLRGQTGGRIYPEFGDYGEITPEDCFRRCVKVGRAILDYVDAPREAYEFVGALDRLRAHPRMQQSVPGTVAAAFGICGRAYGDLGDGDRAYICTFVAQELAPQVNNYATGLRRISKEFNFPAGRVEALQRGENPTLPPSWDSLLAATMPEALLAGDPQRFFESARILFEMDGRSKLAFIRHFRSEEMIGNMWGVAGENEQGVLQVLVVHALLEHLARSGLDQNSELKSAIASYGEIISSMCDDPAPFLARLTQN